MPHIAIAGAGIGGLTAALALAREGCRVTVFERAETLAEVGAGVQLSPNACRVLAHLDCLDAIRRTAVEPDAVLIRRGRDGAALARMALGAGAARRYGSPFLVALRADLQAVLADRAMRHGAITLLFGRSVAAYALAQGGVDVAFAEAGRPVEPFQGLVAADGIRSAVRRQLVGAAPDDARPAGRTAWRSLVPRGAADRDASVPRSNLWLGSRAHLVHYPVDAGRQINVVAIIDEETAPADDAPWSMPADPAELGRRFSGWAEPARRLIAAAPAWRKWPLFDRPPLRRWSDGPVTLLGDAAHPMLPFLAQGAAQAIEDAAVLARRVAMTPGDLPAAFADYAARRRSRTARVQVESRRQATVYHLAAPASTMRDIILRSLGPESLAARYDWLYAGPPADDAAPNTPA